MHCPLGGVPIALQVEPPPPLRPSYGRRPWNPLETQAANPKTLMPVSSSLTTIVEEEGTKAQGRVGLMGYKMAHST